MDEKIIATFCLCDDLLKAIKHPESAFPQQLNDAEVMTIALVVSFKQKKPTIYNDPVEIIDDKARKTGSK